MARAKVDDKTADRLKELADQEMTAAKERLAKRTAAARDFAAATATLQEAEQTWVRVQAETVATKGKAVADLLEADMKPAQVAQLLGIDQKELRAVRAAAPADTGGDGAASAAPGS